MSIFTAFPKGVFFPREMKFPYWEKPIENSSVPVVSIVPLLQHAGVPAECLVQPGDTVREGMLIGRSSGSVSAQVHSPVPGTVREIRDIYLPRGVKSSAVVIDLGGEFDRLGKKNRIYPWENLSKAELLATIADKGVVGLGGVLYPTHLKYSVSKSRKVEALILNGAESEPYLSADLRLMIEKAPEIIEGMRVAAKILEPRRLILGIETGKPGVFEAMKRAVESSGVPIEIIILKSFYPQGDEKQIVKTLLDREVPSGGQPLDVGAVISNPGTLFSIYEAVLLQKPVIERVLTVAGGAIRTPKNLKVRIGTPISALVEECGGFLELPEKIVIRGPMMGYSLYDLDTPVTKGTSGVLFLTSREIKSSRRSNCLNCGRCIECCPMGLDPGRIFKLIDHSEFDDAKKDGLMDCRECGCCGYTCPARIPLVQGMRVGKSFVGNKKVRS
jgi:electron transport complex protein RnfC